MIKSIQNGWRVSLKLVFNSTKSKNLKIQGLLTPVIHCILTRIFKVWLKN